MNFHSQTPSLPLSSYVKSYWMIENVMAYGHHHAQRIVPTGLLELSFYLGDKPTASDDKKAVLENSVVTGQIKKYYEINVSGKLSLFSVYFYPHGLALFLDIPVKELIEQTIPLKYILKQTTNELEDKLALADTFGKRVQIAEQFLYTRIKKTKEKFALARIEHCIHHINAKRGAIEIEDLASAACLSRKQFERTFSEYVGTSPKQFLKVIRFQNAIHLKAIKKEMSLTTLALESGYYDQSHMISDFVSLSGKRPKDYFKECAPFSDYFQ